MYKLAPKLCTNSNKESIYIFLTNHMETSEVIMNVIKRKKGEVDGTLLEK